jgi:hypothetical protein
VHENRRLVAQDDRLRQPPEKAAIQTGSENLFAVAGKTGLACDDHRRMEGLTMGIEFQRPGLRVQYFRFKVFGLAQSPALAILQGW